MNFKMLTIYLALIFGLASSGLGDECGGVLTSVSGQISYKPTERVLENERCVWMVSPLNNASSYRIRLTSDFNYDTDKVLNVASIRIERDSAATIQHLGLDWITTIANTLLVTFHTSDDVDKDQKGFILDYEVIPGELEFYPNENSISSIIKNEAVMFKHPPNGQESYTDNELNIYAFLPTNNLFRESSSRVFVYKRLKLDSCYDAVTVYYFNSNTNHYEFQTKLCDVHDETETFKHNDVSLFIFRSNARNVAEGFTLASTIVQCENKA